PPPHTEVSPLSLHDALPICRLAGRLPRLRVAVPADRPRLLDALARSPVDAEVPDRRLAAVLRRRVPADGGGRVVRLGACRGSRSSGTSPGTSLTEARRGSAAAPFTQRALGEWSAHARRSSRAAGRRNAASTHVGWS